MESEPPQPSLVLLLHLLPALVAAGYAVVGATAGSLSSARKAALRDSFTGVARHALDRYLDAEEKIEARWLLLRALGIGASAALLAQDLGPYVRPAWLASLAISIFAYAVPAELGRHFARPRAESLLPSSLRLARPLEWIVLPFADPLYFVGQILSGPPASRGPTSTLTESEVELLVNEGELNGSLDHDQSEMIRNVLDFGDVTAEELMVPRTRVDGVSASLVLHELQDEVSRSQHSRYPVFSDSIDNVVGVLHVKDLLSAIASGRVTKTAGDLARTPVAFVPEGQLASTVLKEMRAGRHHLAVVVDEFGGVSGILTLEDLLEEIVGDIQDEHDLDDVSRIRMLSPNSALVDASTPVADVNRAVGTDLPEGDYVSLGGLLLENLGRVPAPGTSHEILGLQVLILESDDKCITKVELAGVPGIPRPLTSRPPSSSEAP